MNQTVPRIVAAVVVIGAVMPFLGWVLVSNQPIPPTPQGQQILMSGQNANTPCELAILAMHAHPAHDEQFLTLEANVFDSCPMVEFRFFNHKVTTAYQYPDDGYDFVAHECRSPALVSTRLCETR
jgi:hypothetical protein